MVGAGEVEKPNIIDAEFEVVSGPVQAPPPITLWEGVAFIVKRCVVAAVVGGLGALVIVPPTMWVLRWLET